MFSSMLMRLALAVAATGGENLNENTATGNPVSFTGDIEKALKSLSIPISDETGITGLNIFHGGKNLYKTTATSKEAAGVTYTVNSDGTISLSGTASGYSDIALGDCEIPSSGKITVSGLADATNMAWDGIKILDGSKTVLATVGTGSTSNQTINLDSYTGARYIRMTVKRKSNVATSGTIKPQVEIGETATDFAECTVVKKTVAFGETVKAGTLEAMTGELTVTSPAAKTITLTPVELATNVGANVLWTDTAGSNTVKYYTQS